MRKFEPLFLLLIPISLMLFSFQLWAESNKKKSNTTAPLFEIVTLDRSSAIRDYKILRNAKYAIINGNINLAQSLLMRSDFFEDNMSTLIRKKYLAYIHFIKEEYQQSLEFLSDSRFKNLSPFQHTCLIKFVAQAHTLNFLDNNAKNDFNKCQAMLESKQNGYFYWPRMIFESVQFGLEHFNDRPLPINRLRLNLNSTRFIEKVLFLKSAIYLQREKAFFKNYDLFKTHFKDKDIFKEDLAFLYFRIGNYKKVKELLTKIEKPNSYNILASIAIKENELNRAFQLFQKALEMKRNSLNALEKIVPLSFFFNEPEHASMALKSWPNSTELLNLKYLFLCATQIKLGKWKEAIAYCQRQMRYQNQNSELLQYILRNQLYIHQKRGDKLMKSSEVACEKNDLMSCWIWGHMYASNFGEGKYLIEDYILNNAYVETNQENKNRELIKDPFKNVQGQNEKEEEEKGASSKISLDSLRNFAPKEKWDQPIFVDQKDLEEIDLQDSINISKP